MYSMQYTLTCSAVMELSVYCHWIVHFPFILPLLNTGTDCCLPPEVTYVWWCSPPGMVRNGRVNLKISFHLITSCWSKMHCEILKLHCTCCAAFLLCWSPFGRRTVFVSVALQSAFSNKHTRTDKIVKLKTLWWNHAQLQITMQSHLHRIQ